MPRKDPTDCVRQHTGHRPTSFRVYRKNSFKNQGPRSSIFLYNFAYNASGLRSNAVMPGDEADFRGISVGSVSVRWPSHIACHTVKHGPLQREHGYSPYLWPSPLPHSFPSQACSLLRWSIFSIAKHAVSLPSDVAQYRRLFSGYVSGTLQTSLSLPTKRVCVLSLWAEDHATALISTRVLLPLTFLLSM